MRHDGPWLRPPRTKYRSPWIGREWNMANNKTPAENHELAAHVFAALGEADAAIKAARAAGLTVEIILANMLGMGRRGPTWNPRDAVNISRPVD